MALGDDPVTYRLIQRAAQRRLQQRACVSVAQAADRQLRQAPEPLVRPARARREDQGDRLGQQPAGDERERLRRGLVQPLRVVDQADQRPLLGDIGQQAQYRQSDQEPIRRAAVAQPECRAQRVALRAGQVIQMVQHRRAQLVQPGERQLHLRLHARRPRDPGIRRALRQELQQRRLADPRLAPHHQHSAAARPRIGHEPIQHLALMPPAPQPGLRIGSVPPVDVSVDPGHELESFNSQGFQDRRRRGCRDCVVRHETTPFYGQAGRVFSIRLRPDCGIRQVA